MRGVAIVLAIGACYAPSPAPGSMCVGKGVCPEPLVCSPATNTCEVSAGDRVDARMTDSSMITDADPFVGPPNDLPSGAIDVTAGGTFSTDLKYAHDDIGGGNCGGTGGRDVFYEVTLADPQVYYFDTFGSSFDTVVRVYDGSCASVASGAAIKACADDACGGKQSQVAVSLAAGTSCIVVDQASSAETGDDVTLKVMLGGRDGLPLGAGMQATLGNTCSAANTFEPSPNNCDAPGSGGKDLGYFITVCPGASLLLDANTCTSTTWDTVLYVRRGGTGPQVGCNDDNCGAQSQVTNVSLANGLLFWLIVDGFDPTECGAYTLTTNLR